MVLRGRDVMLPTQLFILSSTVGVAGGYALLFYSTIVLCLFLSSPKIIHIGLIKELLRRALEPDAQQLMKKEAE